jgi:uncharacterized protein (DUF2336 family)
MQGRRLAAVCLGAVVQNLLENLEATISTRSSQERVALLRSVTDLFLVGLPLSDRKVDALDNILCRLVQHIESRALVELSTKMARVDAAPAQLIHQLARNDDIEVSGPVLAESSRLLAEDLVEIASTKSQAHLAAIASRKVVDESVSDVLVDRGDTRVAQIIAGNAGAKFSDGGYSRLVTRAESEEGVAELVAARADLSPEHLRELVTKATDTVRQRLLAAAPEARAKVEKVLVEVASEIDREASAAPRRDYGPAQRFVQSVRHDPALMRVSLRDSAQSGKVEHAVVLLAALSSMPIPAIERVLLHGQPGGILILCRAIDVDWKVVTALLSLRTASGASMVASSDSMFEQFRKLTVPTSQRVVRFWQVRESVGNAAENRH